MDSFALYIHYPWCKSLCRYCDFNKYLAVDSTIVERYFLAVIKDLKFEAPNYFKKEIRSIYLGGGTPSIIKLEQLTSLVEQIFNNFSISDKCEITIELNPEDAELKYLHKLKALGFNRISLGVQSFDNFALKSLGRNHTRRHILNAIKNIRRAEFTNLNVDLLFNNSDLASSTVAFDDVNCLISFNPEHISLYEINTLETINAMNLDNQRDGSWSEIFFSLQQLLFENGYIQYEINSYSKKNFQCLHNLNTWTFGDYLGVGAGAVSRQSKGKESFLMTRPSDPRSYIEKFLVEANYLNYYMVSQDYETQASDYLISLTRLKKGFSLQDFYQKNSRASLHEWAKKITKAKHKGLLREEKGIIRPTPLGYRFLDDLHLMLGPSI
ncbi:MAG: radical SAM family heme chaperone HemW [Pseudomonadota bacterium]|nr:radical SAM family heme chaperone HemW [Pseudomonadota bacterium]